MKRALLSLLASSALMAGGYNIPEKSVNSVALSSALVAHSIGADAAYYNPANISFMDNGSQIEFNLMYIGLSKIDYKGSITTPLATTNGVNTSSEKENFFSAVILLHITKNWRYEILFKYGKSGRTFKRWSQQPAAAHSEEFTLQTIEVNPSASYMLNDILSLAAGLRVVHSSGVVKGQIPGVYLQNLEGDSFDFGYNLALAYKPSKELEIGVTYRSNIDLTVDGDADVYHVVHIPTQRNVGASVTVPLPAQMNIALAYTIEEKTTLEFVYERNFWSSYKSLNFDFEDVVAEAAFGSVKSKNWKDVSAYRFGVTHLMDRYTLMAGIVFDNTPIPDSTLGLELPDSDSTSISAGMRYQIDEKLDFGVSALYSMRDDRKVNNTALNGEFTDSKILLVSTGIGYKF